MKNSVKAWRIQLGTFLLICLVGLGAETAEAAGALPVGEKSIVLISADGTEFPIGRVAFSEDGDGRRITVRLNAPEFQEEFLSMRPFRCLRDSKEMWCHLAYPYETRSRVTEGDLVDLEYALLFLYKSPNTYGIDAWNGLYFKLEPDGSGGLKGNLHEVDLNVLAVPPVDGDLRPIPHASHTPVAADAHRFARVVIR